MPSTTQTTVPRNIPQESGLNRPTYEQGIATGLGFARARRKFPTCRDSAATPLTESIETHYS